MTRDICSNYINDEFTEDDINERTKYLAGLIKKYTQYE